MKVFCAKHAGACYGVNRAIKAADRALEEAQDLPVYTLGPLIHNPKVVEDLQSRGAITIDHPSKADYGTLILRTHGVTPDLIQEAEGRGLNLVDATCPHVAKVHDAASKLSRDGYYVFILGEAGHPEVEGISSRAGSHVLVLESADDLPHPLPSKRIGIVVQTTQTVERLDTLIAAIHSIDPNVDLQVRNTICNATRNRQNSAKEVAQQSDVMIVLGGKFSGNTTRLAQICKEICPRTYHIESLDELNIAWFLPDDMVGVTAGASTPNEQVQELVNYLKNLEVG